LFKTKQKYFSIFPTTFWHFFTLPSNQTIEVSGITFFRELALKTGL